MKEETKYWMECYDPRNMKDFVRQIDSYDTAEECEDSAWLVRRLSPSIQTRIIRVYSRSEVVT
jgi:hypothetical protein